jgi:hypothetical protein
MDLTRAALLTALTALAACHEGGGKGPADASPTEPPDPHHSGPGTTEPHEPPPPLQAWSRDVEDTPGSVAVTELMVDAGPGDPLEWIELYNPAVVDLELTGWTLRGAVDYAFPAGTRLPARGHLVVASDPTRLAGAGALGPFAGRLDDSGERLELFTNGGRRVESVRYGAAEPWPVGADGTGHSLAKRWVEGPGDLGEGWVASPERGGTPGAPNGVDPLAPPVVADLVPADATWRVDDQGGPGDAGWADVGYDDSGWATGAAPFVVAGSGLVPATIRYTADNDAAVYLGAADGSDLQLVADDFVGDWTTAKSVATVVGPADHLFVVAWEDPAYDGGPQMVIAEVELPSGVVGTSAAAVEWALGPAGGAPTVGADPPPTEAEVAAAVAAADLAGSWGTPAAEAPPASAPWGPTVGASFDPSTSYVWPDTFGDVSITNLDATWVVLRSVDPVVGAGTPLPTAPRPARFRIDFDLQLDPASAELHLDCDVDDGARFVLNGTEVLRHHLPAGPLAADTLATVVVTDDPSLVATVPPGACVRGLNTLAVEVFQATPDPAEDLRFGCALTARASASDPSAAPLAFAEVPAAGAAPFVVDLLVGDVPDGLTLTSSAGGAWAVPPLEAGLAAVPLEPAPAAGDVLVLEAGDGTLLDAVRVDVRGWARLDDAGPWRVPDEPTPGAPNAVTVEGRVVLNELAYHRAARSVDGAPVEERPDEWLELHNRSDEDVDLSGWQLVDAVEYVFPEGTTLAAGGFLVVAGDASALRAEVPGVTVVGDFVGTLADSTDRVVLRDARGNPVDAVRYFDGGRWPDAADGGGSTLERRDPWADGLAAEAWAPSDESAGAGWTDVVVSGVAAPSAVGPDGLWDELVLGLLDAGEVLIDDVSVVRDDVGIELVVDGGFDAPGAWRLLGNHRHSAVVPDPDDPGNPVLRLVATGPTEHMHNHAETTLRAPVATASYTVRLRARWVSGSNALHSRLYFQRLPRVTRIPRPDAWGTPGRANSRREDLGPTYADLRHEPAAPAPGEPVSVRVTAADPDGLGEVVLWSSVDGGPFEASAMAPGGGGTHVGALEGQPAGTVVQFYVEATDGQGARSTFPTGGPTSRALVRWDAADLPGDLHSVRLILTAADSDWLHDPPNLMSNDRLGATVVLDDARAVYDVGVRAKGSERGRPSTVRLGYGLQFPRESPFRGSQRTVLLDRSQGVEFGQREFLLNLVAGRVGLPSAEYNDLAWAVTPRPEHTGTVELQIDRLSDLVLDNQFARGGDGPEYDYELVYYPYTTDDGTPEGQKLPQPDGVVGTPLTDLGPDPEAWRWTFALQNRREHDDHQPAMDLCRAVAGTSGDPVEDVIDVDQWLASFAFATLAGAGDNYGGDGAQHNARFYARPEDGRLLYFPHDLDYFGASTMPVVGNGDLQRLIADPGRRRTYYQHLFDLVDRGFAPAALDADCAQVALLLPAQDLAGACRQMRDRADWVLAGAPDAVLARYPVVPFAITTRGGADFAVAAADVTLEGDGWIDVREVWWSGSPAPLAVTWLDADSWRVVVPLAPGANAIALTATDLAGATVGTDTITVSSTP